MKQAFVAVIVALGLTLGGQSAEAQLRFVGTAATPSGFALYGNTAAVAISGTYGQWRGGAGSDRLDASAALSFGVGNPYRGLGLQADVNITSFRDFGYSGYFSLTLHRAFQVDQAGVYSIALSASHLAAWGNSARVPVGGSLVGSYLTAIDGKLAMFSLGIANNLNDDRRVRGIVGFGMAVNDDWSVNAGWVGDQSVFGATWQPRVLGGTAISVSLRGVEDRNRRLIGIDVSRSFRLSGI